jgi:hypothetical protein
MAGRRHARTVGRNGDGHRHSSSDERRRISLGVDGTVGLGRGAIEDAWWRSDGPATEGGTAVRTARGRTAFGGVEHRTYAT